MIDEREMRYIARAISSYEMRPSHTRISDYMETYVDMKRSHARHMVDSKEVGGLESLRAEMAALQDVIVAVLVAANAAEGSGLAELEHKMETACCAARRETKKKVVRGGS